MMGANCDLSMGGRKLRSFETETATEAKLSPETTTDYIQVLSKDLETSGFCSGVAALAGIRSG